MDSRLWRLPGWYRWTYREGQYGPAHPDQRGGESHFGGTAEQQTVWMSHRDAVSEVPEGFTVTASTDVCPIAAMENAAKNLYSTQFRRGQPHRSAVLRCFLTSCSISVVFEDGPWITSLSRRWRRFARKVGDGRVIWRFPAALTHVAALVTNYRRSANLCVC